MHMGTTRRTFVKQAAGLTAACLAGFKSEPFTQAQSLRTLTSGAARGGPGREASGWDNRPMRWAQVAFVEDDPGNYDLNFWLDYFKKTHCDAARLSAGGVVAFYPTQ